MRCCRVLHFPRRSRFSQAVEHGTSSPWPSAHPTPLLSAFDELSDSLDRTPKATGEKELDTSSPEKTKAIQTQVFTMLPELQKFRYELHRCQDHRLSSSANISYKIEIQRHPVHLLPSLLHLQIGTHGVQKTHRRHLHPLPPLHHPKNKTLLIRNHTDKCDCFRKLFFQQAESSPLHYGRDFLQVPPLPILHHYLLRSPAVSGRKANIPFLSII